MARGCFLARRMAWVGRPLPLGIPRPAAGVFRALRARGVSGALRAGARECPKSVPNHTPSDGPQELFQVISGMLCGAIRANRFARFARITRFARIGNSSDSCESACHAIKIGGSIANDSRESIRANRVANRPCH